MFPNGIRAARNRTSFHLKRYLCKHWRSLMESRFKVDDSTFIRARCCNSICSPRRCNAFTMELFDRKSSSFKLHARNDVRVRRFLTSVTCCSSCYTWKGLPQRPLRGAGDTKQRLGSGRGALVYVARSDRISRLRFYFQVIVPTWVRYDKQ
jgi:hypothetical protein